MTKSSIRAGRFIAFATASGATVDPKAPQRLTLLASDHLEINSAQFSQDVKFRHIADFTFSFSDEVVTDIELNKDLPAETTESSEFKKFVMIKALAGLHNAITEIQSTFSALPPEKYPSLTEFIEVCMQDKLLIVGLDTNQPSFEPTSNKNRLVPMAVESYYKDTVTS